jgi:hypothetical protein
VLSGARGGHVHLGAHELLYLEVAIVLLHHVGDPRFHADGVRRGEVPAVCRGDKA